MKKFIIWGCRLHQHTNSYIYAAFYKAAKAMGLDSYWLHSDSDVSGIDFSDSLFITEGQHDGNIPIRNDCTYVLHNCTNNKWDSAKRKIRLQTYTYDADQKWGALPLDGFPGSYVLPSGEGMWQPWATDLLPDEINTDWINCPRTTEIHWVGTICDGQFGNINEINNFINTAILEGYSWHHHVPGSTSFEVNKDLIQKSFLAPTITGKWQTDFGYIPCRIFKNSSYGHLMATNNKASYDVMDGNGIYEHDTRKLFYKAQQAANNKNLIKKSMIWIKENHTFINRINSILHVVQGL